MRHVFLLWLFLRIYFSIYLCIINLYFCFSFFLSLSSFSNFPMIMLHYYVLLIYSACSLLDILNSHAYCFTEFDKLLGFFFFFKYFGGLFFLFFMDSNCSIDMFTNWYYPMIYRMVVYFFLFCQLHIFSSAFVVSILLILDLLFC